MSEINRSVARRRRHERVRENVTGTSDRPRLNVFRSSKQIYAQVIDDSRGCTIVAASTLDAELRDQLGGLNKTEQAKLVGSLVAKRALEKGVTRVVFDRGGYLYHGRVKALADAARKDGLEF